MDTSSHHRINDHLFRQEYTISYEIHRVQNNWHHKLQNVEKQITRWLISDYENILLSTSKRNSIMWIYTGTCWATLWHPAQFRQIGGVLSNRPQIDCWRTLTTRNAKIHIHATLPWSRLRRAGPELFLTQCRSIGRFILCFCCCCLIIVYYQNHLLKFSNLFFNGMQSAMSII